MNAMSSALATAIEHAYRVFSACPPPAGLLDVCTRCCVDPEVELQMRTLPLRQLGREHFLDYNFSAKSEAQPAAEIQSAPFPTG